MFAWAVSSNAVFFVCFCFMLNIKTYHKNKAKIDVYMFLFDELKNRKDHIFSNQDTIILGEGGGKSIPSMRHFCV